MNVISRYMSMLRNPSHRLKSTMGYCAIVLRVGRPGGSPPAPRRTRSASPHPVVLGVEGPELAGLERAIHLRRIGVLGQWLRGHCAIVGEREGDYVLGRGLVEGVR